MNKRIWELANQCQEYRSGFDGQEDWHTVFNKEKFAELIIRECIEQCSKALVEHTGQPSVTHNYAVGLCQDNIKDHFGVES